MTEKKMTQQEQTLLEQGYVSARAASEMMQIHFATVYRLIEAGKIQAVKVGDKTFVSVQSIYDHLGVEGCKLLGLTAR